MKASLSFLLCLLFLSACFADDVQNLVQTEHEFAAMSVKLGMREAFLAYLADDSVLFRPDAVPGKEWMEEHPPRSGILSWEPTLAEAASDLGYTSGPWEFREKTLQDKPVAYGYFVTLWKKESDGKWKVVLDTGTTNPAPATSASLSLPPASAVAKKANEDLLKTDQAFCVNAKTVGDVLADAVLLYRDNVVPISGKQAALAAVNQTAICTPAKANVSSDGVLGYTYGTYTSNQQKGNYVRVWKNLSGAWKVIIDVSTPD